VSTSCLWSCQEGKTERLSLSLMCFLGISKDELLEHGNSFARVPWIHNYFRSTLVKARRCARHTEHQWVITTVAPSRVTKAFLVFCTSSKLQYDVLVALYELYI
jgi:hypothetical protein